MRRSSACRLGGGGCASVTKKPSSSDHSRPCSTPCHLAASARKNAASVELCRAAAMAASALASPYCAAVTVGRQPSRPALFSWPSAWQLWKMQPAFCE